MQLRSLLWLALAGGCATRVSDLQSTATHARHTAQLWSQAGDPAATFILLAPPGLAEDLAGSAAACGYDVRTATADDLRGSWPVR